MELVYSISPQEKDLLHSAGHSDSSRICSCWSRNNLLAYTWEKVVHGFIERYISILDPNQPWNAQHIPLANSSVTCLQWNDTGMKLLYGTSNGLCAVWSASKNLTNCWKEKPVLNSDLHSEVILAVSWLCVGRNVQFNPDKPSNLRDGESKDKVSKTNQYPTLTQIGGQSMEGYVVVTPSGILAVKCLTQIEQPVSAKTQLKNVFTNLRVADIAFTSKGNIVVMASNGNIHHPVQFWSINISYDDDALRLSFEVDVMPSITMDCISKDVSCPYTEISHMNFVSRPSSDHVIVCVSHANGSAIEAWLYKEHKEAPPDLHPAFVSQSVMEEKIKRWKKVMTAQDLPRILHLSLPTVSLSSSSMKIASEINLMNILGICIVFPDNVIKYLHRITLVEMFSHRIPENVLSNVESHEIGKKRPRSDDITSTVRHARLSPMSCALSAFDNRGNIIMFKVPPWLTKSNQMAVHSLAQLLCFCVWTGQERWDVLLHVDHNIANHVCEQVRCELGSNSKVFLRLMSFKLHSLEMSVYQRSSRFSEATDCHLRLMFASISVVFRSLLKPPHNSNDEQDPADKLREACTSSYETDIARFLLSVDTDQKVLQSLQQLIQYVSDVALYLVTLLPQMKQGITNVPGASLLRDHEFLENLRELLVIIQMWKLLKAACAPVFFSLDENPDWLPVVFESLTELVRITSSTDFKGAFPDSVVESSRTLSNKIIVPSIDVISPANGILQRIKPKRPLRFEFGRTPRPIQISYSYVNANHVRVEAKAKVDHLRRIHLGVSPATQWKTCSRCGVTSVLRNAQGSFGLEFWEKRFNDACICGGNWNVDGHAIKK